MSKFEIDFNEHKFKLETKLENEKINFILTSENFKSLKGTLSLEQIISQVPLFEDNNLEESYEIINDLKSSNFSLIEDSEKYKLNIKITILKKEKNLQVDLTEFTKTKDQIISELKNLKDEVGLKLTNLQDKYLKLMKECEELLEKNKALEKKLENIESEETNQNDETYKNFEIENKKAKMVLTDHPNSVQTITILTDGRLATGSYQNIIIYSPKVYNLILNIKKKNFDVKKLKGLSTGKLAVYFAHNFDIYHIEGKKYKIIQSMKFNSVICFIEMDNKSLAISTENSIIVYSLNYDDTYSKSYDITSQFKLTIYAIVQTKPNEICASCKFNETEFLSFYNLDTKEAYAFTKNIPLSFYGFKLNSKTILFYKNDCVYVVNSRKHELLSKFQLDFNERGDKNSIFSLCVLTSNMVLIGDIEGYLLQYKLEGDELIEISRKEKVHSKNKGYSDEVSSICVIGDGHIATGGFDKRVKIW